MSKTYPLGGYNRFVGIYIPLFFRRLLLYAELFQMSIFIQLKQK